MAKSRINILCFMLLFVSANASSQIIKNDTKIFKEQIIFIDTITIDNPIIIKFEYSKSFGGIYF